jgi:sulfite reductase alpha subunit-like flavoprotein
MASHPVLILVGTLTGNADAVARDLAAAFDLVDFTPTVLDMYDADLTIFERYQDIVICTSTQGEGDLPPNAEPLYDALTTAVPDLSSVAFAVCALGDHDYDPFFCEAGKTFAALFEQLGATRVMPNFEFDGEPTERAVEYAQAWALDVAACFHAVAVEVAA